MFSHISWHDYCLYSGLAVVAYYVVIITLYYRQNILSLFKKKQTPSRTDVLENDPAQGNENGYAPLPEAEQAEALEQLEAISSSIAEIADLFGDNANKEALIQRMAATLSEQHSPALLNEYKDRIDWHISQQVQLYNRIALSDADLEKIWQFASEDSKQKGGKPGLTLVLLAILCTVITRFAEAQDGNAGITEATSKVKSYFTTGCNLMYAIGAVVGLVGAVKVFNKWNQGDPDTSKTAASWFGSCIFLVVVATVLKSFFGV